MKILLILSVLLSFNVFSQQVDENAGKLGRAICGTYTDGDKIVQNIDETVKYYMKVDNPAPDQIAIYLNKNLHEMTCVDDGKEVNYMHYSMHRKSFAFFELFKNYLMDEIWMKVEDESININVNAVSFYGAENRPETVLDYMERESALLEDGGERKARLDQTIFIFKYNFEAKRFSELPKTEQTARLKQLSVK